jgi:hypothetical protein
MTARVADHPRQLDGAPGWLLATGDRYTCPPCRRMVAIYVPAGKFLMGFLKNHLFSEDKAYRW